MDFEIAVKFNIYDTIVETTKAPTVAEVAKVLDSSVDEVREAFNKLCEKRLLVLEADSDKIRMAPPFSGVETLFRVKVGRKSYFANCVWDALGVAAALHDDGDVATTCGDCGEAMSLEVRDGAPLPQDCAIHFAVPAAHWWDDIVYT